MTVMMGTELVSGLTANAVLAYVCTAIVWVAFERILEFRRYEYPGCHSDFLG